MYDFSIARASIAAQRSATASASGSGSSAAISSLISGSSTLP